MKIYKRANKIVLVLTLLVLLSIPAPVMAQGLIYGDSIPAGTTIDQDVILVGQNVRIAGTVNGNVFILGNQVQIDGQINGSLALIGQNVGIEGEVSGGTYALALTLELGPGSQLDRDLYALSVSLASGNDSRIERDLYAIGLDAGLNGQVGRDLHTTIGPIQLYNGLMTLLGFEELTLRLRFELPQPTPDDGTSREVLPITSRARILIPRNRSGEPFDWGGWGINIAREWGVLALFGLLAVWLAPKRLERTKLQLLTRPWNSGLVGLLVLVISVNLFAVGALVAALVFSLGLGLNYLGLWQLSIALWLLAFAALTILLTLLWLFIVYGAKVLVAYALFTWMSAKLDSARWLQVVALLVGLFVYVLLRSIPMVGWVFAVLVTAYGLGMAWNAYRHQGEKPPVKGAAKRKAK
jgi:hypothetical protein